MQTELIAFTYFHLKNFDKKYHEHAWESEILYPTITRHGIGGKPFELFSRAASQKYFNKLKIVLGIQNPNDLAQLVEQIMHDENEYWIHKWASFRTLLNYDFLATQD